MKYRTVIALHKERNTYNETENIFNESVQGFLQNSSLDAFLFRESMCGSFAHRTKQTACGACAKKLLGIEKKRTKINLQKNMFYVLEHFFM